MSDFDTLLERLLVDQKFKATLAADPDRALRGYHLDDSERALLTANLSTDAGSSSLVEQRTSKAGMVGMFAVVAEAFAGVPGGSGPSGLAADASHVAPPADSDDDGIWDVVEGLHGTDPHDADSDNDGVVDGMELQIGTDPTKADSDADGYPDYVEIVAGTDPTDHADSPAGPIPTQSFPAPYEDQDGMATAYDATATAELDTDHDGLSDVEELELGTDPTDQDTDNDLLTDWQEGLLGTDPLDPDTDDDGYTDGHEYLYDQPFDSTVSATSVPPGSGAPTGAAAVAAPMRGRDLDDQALHAQRQRDQPPLEARSARARDNINAQRCFVAVSFDGAPVEPEGLLMRRRVTLDPWRA